MKRLIVILLVLFSNLIVQAQEKDTIVTEKLNEYLTELYSNSNTYFDTSELNFRNECMELIQSHQPDQKRNGLITLGLLDLYAKHTQAAIDYFNQALAIDSNCYQCYLKLHWIYFYLKHDYPKANSMSRLGVSKFEAAVKADSSSAENWSKLYNMYELNESRQTEKSKQRMKWISMKRVTLNPSNAYYQWEHSFHCAPSEKEFYLKKAFQLNPTEDIYWNALANYYCEKKNLDAVLEVMNQVKPEEMNSSYWYQQMAVYYYRLGKKLEAKAIYQEAKKLGFEIVYKY